MDTKKKKIPRVIIGIGLAVVIVVSGMMLNNILSRGSCSIPEGSSFKNIEPGLYKVHGMNSYVYVAKGITIGDFSEVTTYTSEKVPSCYLKEEGISSFQNLILEDENGQIVPLLRGFGGSGSGEGFVTASSPLQ